MKKLFFKVAILFFMLMFSSPSFAEWTKVTVSTDGSEFFVDFERVRKHGGSVYFWGLDNFLVPDRDGDLSVIKYQQVDCDLLRRKLLSGFAYKRPMATGIRSSSYNFKSPEWDYPPPKSALESVLQAVCSK